MDVVTPPIGSSPSFLLHFEERVRVEGKHAVGNARESPDFGDLLNDVTLFDGFFQFGCGIGTSETSLQVIVDAMVTSFDFHTFDAAWKSVFATTGVWQDGMVKTVGLKNFAFHQSKVTGKSVPSGS